jgi:hypothetical protein
MAATRLILLTLLSASMLSAGQISVTSNATLTSANSAAVAGDTVLIAAGTYTVPIAPTSDSVTYTWSTVGSVCSLYVTSGTAIVINGVDYIHIIGIRAQTAWSVAGHALEVTDADHFLIQNCRIYGGSTRGGQGDYTAFAFQNTHYGRIYNCLFDRQDPVVTTDDDQGDGVSWYESSHLIFEYDTVRNVSHSGWYGPATRSGSTPAWAQLNGPVVMRNVVAYDCHNPFDLQNAGHTILLDGARVWSPMVKNTYKGGHALEYAIERAIVRYGMFYNDSTRTQTSGGMNDSPSGAFITMGDPGSLHMGPYALRVYNNAFLAAPYGNALPAWSLFISRQGNYDAPWGHSVYKNNIVANPSDTNLINYNDRSLSMANALDTLDRNLLWDGTPGGDVIDFEMSDGDSLTLAECIAANPNFMRATNFEASPLWVDSLSVRGSRSFEISGTSPAKDAGVALTRLRAGTTSAVIPVADSKYFWYPHSNPYDRGDSIAIRHAGAWTRCLVDSVDTTANNIIVHAAVTLSAGDSVYLLAGYVASTGAYTNRLHGLRPDIGPYEIGAGSPDPPASVPDTTTHVQPANGSTQAQPITFRWRSVPTATQYWLSASYDGWVHDHVSVTLSDTFYTYTGFPIDTLVIWNVAAGNAAGWGAWTSAWSFRTQATVSYGDTITVNWNNASDTQTLSDNTTVLMANIQRVQTILIVKNPSGKLIEWSSNVSFPGTVSPPQPSAGDTTVYIFIRDGSRVKGFDLTDRSTQTGATQNWVVSTVRTMIHDTLAGPVNIGNATSYTRIDSAGITFAGNATMWEDIRIAGSQMGQGATAPDPVSFLGGLKVYGFNGDATTEQMYFEVQMPHAYKEGSTIYPHVHWMPTTANTGNVVWQLEYVWAAVDSVFGSLDTLQTAAAATGGVAWKHHMTSFPPITGRPGLSSMLVCRLFRNPGYTGDDYEFDAGLLEVDFHYETDAIGSRGVTTK